MDIFSFKRSFPNIRTTKLIGVRIKKNINAREKNFSILKKFFKKYPFIFDLPVQDKYLKTAWLAYPVIIKKSAKLNRKDLQIFLEKSGIQTRTIFTGNILRQPIMKNQIYKKVKNSEINANFVMTNGMLIGCHHGLTLPEINFMIKKFKEFLKLKNL